MNGGLLLVLGLLIACVELFIVDKARMDVVALLVIIILPLIGIITMSKALAGAWRVAPRELRRYPRSLTDFSASREP
jgi:hypothetical protein